MRFLVENGAYNLDNLGDNAMLRVTVERLLRRWPRARVDVVTNEPELVRRHLPGATPLLAGPWHRLPIVPLSPRFEHNLWSKRVRWWERHLDGFFPRLADAGRRRYARKREPSAEAPAREFFDTIQSADAVVCCGGGLINDWFHEHARRILATLRAAQGLGKPTAMFGLGLGPLTLDHARRRAAPVLRRLEMLALRESDLGPRLAAEMGVPSRAIRVTGDDAIELAMGAAEPAARDQLGVNLRLAPHAEVPDGVLPAIGQTLREAAARFHARIAPLPVRSVRNRVNDVDAVAQLVGEEHVDLTAARAMLDPADLIAAAARCRVVVTGAYHSAVFALSCGVPVIGLAQSAYYQSKLNGVAFAFGGGGMTVFRYDDPGLPAKLAAEIDRLWASSETLRPGLREAARRQVRQSRDAYEAFFQRVVAPTPLARSRPERAATQPVVR